MTLFQHIKNYPTDKDITELFTSLKLYEGAALLNKIQTTDTNNNLIAKYTCDCYDPESELHDAFPNSRTELKKAVLKSFGVSDLKIFDEILNGENEKYEAYVSWYYTQIQDYLGVAIIVCKEVLEMQLAAARMKISRTVSGKQDEDDKNMDDDRYLKAINIQNTCLNNGLDNIKRLKELETERLKKYERVDSAMEQEIYNNSGSAERIALMAQKLNNK